MVCRPSKDGGLTLQTIDPRPDRCLTEQERLMIARASPIGCPMRWRRSAGRAAPGLGTRACVCSRLHRASRPAAFRASVARSAAEVTVTFNRSLAKSCVRPIECTGAVVQSSPFRYPHGTGHSGLTCRSGSDRSEKASESGWQPSEKTNEGKPNGWRADTIKD